ncbi:hypothetical protein [Helicobacter sp.]|uniref:hypothetical protein n=1 Tax=Helicobacter sp. TaxID=218 RepID=UPI002A910B64|nr:hypothetical protein [Helicobacter sp.]MDY5557061.1 hypothetical protein [Helicobacter sp.]
MPLNDSKKANFPNYSQFVFGVLPRDEIKMIDTIFIDGRFRVACALSTLLYCPNSTIMIHDFFNRLQYRIVLEFLDTIEACETLGVFKPKKRLNKANLQTLLEQYAYIVD